MMSLLWVVLFVALNGFHLGCGSPVRPTPQSYPHDADNPPYTGWGGEGGMHAVVPALALAVAAASILLGCTWCYRHKDCKPNEGTDNQLFTTSAGQLHETRRSHPPDSGFSEPVNNNISEDNNNGPISLREMQNIANNNAAAYIVSENEERNNRISRESVVEFEPLPSGIRIVDPLERCADWFGEEDFARNHLQYLREIGRGWFGRVVEGEIEESGSTSAVAVKILSQNASLDDKARFLDEAKMYRDVRHENVLAFIAKCLQEDPWILIFELCSMDLQQYLVINRPKMAILNESGLPLRLMSDVTVALTHLHSRGYLYGNLWSGGVLVRGDADNARAVLGRYCQTDPQHECSAPETRRHPPMYTSSSEVWSLGNLIWEVCAWGSTPARHPPPLPDLPCPYRNHLYQVMQLCWNANPASRPTSSQVQALIDHLYITHTEASEPSQDDGYGSSDFEERWQRLKPNTIPKVDEHIAIVHAPSTSMTSHFTGSDQELDNIQTIHDTLSVDMDTAVSRSSSIMSDKDPLSVQIKSDSLTNLHGSLEDVRNIYLTHNEMAVLECHQGNISHEESREKEHDKSDSSVDPWVKDIMAGSQDDVSYYKDVSDVIKNLDNILNSEKTSSSESSHQASPSRDNLTLDCKKDYQMPSCLVKSPGITNFQNIIEHDFDNKSKDTESGAEDDTDRDTIGTLSHSFERHSDTISQQTLENMTPDTPLNDVDVIPNIEYDKKESRRDLDTNADKEAKSDQQNRELPKDNYLVASDNNVPKLKELCVASVISVSKNDEKIINKDCRTACDSKLTEMTDIRYETKSIDYTERLKEVVKRTDSIVTPEILHDTLPNFIVQINSNTENMGHHDFILKEYSISGQSSASLEQVKNCQFNSVASDVVNNYDGKEFVISDIIANGTYGTKNEPSESNCSTFIEIEKAHIEDEEHTFFFKEPSISLLCSPTDSYTENVTRRLHDKSKDESSENIQRNDMKSERNKEYGLKENYDQISHILHPACDEIGKSLEDESISIHEKSQEILFKRIQPDSDEELKAIEYSSQYNPENTERTDSNETILTKQDLSSLQSTFIEASALLLKAEIEGSNIYINSMKGHDNQKQLTKYDIDNEFEIKHVDSVFTFLQEESAQNSDSDTIGELNNSIKEAENNRITEDTVFQNKNIIAKISENNLIDSITLNEPKVDTEIVCAREDVESAHDIICKKKQPTAVVIAELRDKETINSSTNFELIHQSNDVMTDIATTYFIDKSLSDSLGSENKLTFVVCPETTQNLNEIAVSEFGGKVLSPVETSDKSNNINVDKLEELTNDSTVYMDIVNTDNGTLKTDVINDDVKKVIQSCLNSSPIECISLFNNESTMYLELPSVDISKEMNDFLHMERIESSKCIENALVSSTPIVSDSSTENVLDNSFVENDTKNLSDTKVTDIDPVDTLTKVEQTCVPESISPFESPTKSHHTDTFDENSSVVLGPFENCSLELFKGFKTAEFVDFPREELLAFSSNFSEINLETPSPLRDGNFLNEVPDIAHDDFVFDDIATLSESVPAKSEPQTIDKDAKAEHSEPQTETNTDESGQSVTEKRISPSTPPNSPGVFTASTSQQKYLVDIDLNDPSEASCQPLNTFQNEIDLNQIELQITSKLAIAENENNLNIEYSGPLNIEAEDISQNDAIPETYLAGNGGLVPPQLREKLTLDEESVQALRNELELKLPLAQVAAIEPQCENEWSLELPPPPELVVNYPGALSPIAEETGQQLCAYENDANWNVSARTDSSESYPEPCNNSTDETTDIPTGVHSEPRSDLRSDTRSDGNSDDRVDDETESPGDEHKTRDEDDSNDHGGSHGEEHSDANTDVRSEPHEHSTYTVRSRDNSLNTTYNVYKDVGSSKEMTMSADSLNASPFKNLKTDVRSPVNDKTYNKNEDEKESSCERISQVSPFLLSPTTDTSAPENSDNLDNATGVSTLSKTTEPTDAKLSKPSECLSKATSIDSWCSNDTLYNVEENFDDLVMDTDLPTDFAKEKDEGNSESTDTLTHNDDDKELSHCSTYIIHDSKSEACETFSPDSITANDKNTYTKVKTEPAGTTPSIMTKSDLNDSTKNSQTKDLAYGTLMSGLPSYSNCTTEVASAMDDTWQLPQPELVRRSPIKNIEITPPKFIKDKQLEHNFPQLPAEPKVKKMDSVEIDCLQDSFIDGQSKSDNSGQNLMIEINDSPIDHYRNNMAPSITSTPFVEFDNNSENVQAIPINLPEIQKGSIEHSTILPNFKFFQQSAEVRPQDLSSNNDMEKIDHEILLDGETGTFSMNSNRESLAVSDKTPNYSDFEYSASAKPQDSKDKSSQIEIGVSSEEFWRFEDSVKNCPQDLSSIINASSLLLKSERLSSELAMSNSSNNMFNPSIGRVNIQSLDISPPNVTNLIESHSLVNCREPNTFLINFDRDDEMEQPHSIIITEAPFDVLKESSNVTYDSHTEAKLIDLNCSYDSTSNIRSSHNEHEATEPRINGDLNLDINYPLNNEDLVTENIAHILQEPSENNIEGSSKQSSNDIRKGLINEDVTVNGKNENYATVNFLSETFEELIESNVDDADVKDKIEEETDLNPVKDDIQMNKSPVELPPETSRITDENITELRANGVAEMVDEKISSVTDNFLQNEKKFCQLDSYFPLLSDIRFTGPATEIMSTSFTQESPTEPMSPECEQEEKPNTVGVLIKEWDSDSDSSNSSSGEFIWKGGDGIETPVLPTTHFQHQRDGGSEAGPADSGTRGSEGGGLSDGSGDSGSGSGSEGDEVEFVPSSWDCRAAPSKSSLRSLEQAPPDNKKRVVFKRQKYHCVYEYPREAADADADAHSPAPYLPDFSTYSDWDPSSAEDAELGYGQLFGAPSPLDLYPLRTGIAFGSDYDEDFFISSSARPFESLGIMSTTSQFFPGMHVKPAALLERDLSDDVTEDFPPPPSPLPATLVQTRAPSLDFTTPDSGVEDITPGSTTDEDFKTKRLPDGELTWRTVDSASSSESVSPSSPGGAALGGLRHTRDKLKLDLPPSPHIPSPRHNRVFNFVLDKPKRRSQDTPVDAGNTPLVMTDETPIATTALPLQKPSDDLPQMPEPTFSTFGKCLQKVEPEQKIILTEDVDTQKDAQDESSKVVEAVKGEGTVLDSGDEDSGIESSSKATLERNKTPNVS